MDSARAWLEKIHGVTFDRTVKIVRALKTRREANLTFVIAVTITALTGCGSMPRTGEYVTVNVDYVFTPEIFGLQGNEFTRLKAKEMGLGEDDIKMGRIVKVSCGVGSDWPWRSVAYLPAGMHAHEKEILNLRVDNEPEYPNAGWNPLVSRAEELNFPGSSSAYQFIPDWRERGLARNFERIPLDANQRGLFHIVFGEYLIKCHARR